MALLHKPVRPLGGAQPALEVPVYTEEVPPALKVSQPQRGCLRVDRCFNTGFFHTGFGGR